MIEDQYIYLFEDHDNGWGNCYRTYFSSDKELNQELVNEFIRQVNPIAGRMGSSFEDLQEGAEANRIIIKELAGQHKTTGGLAGVFKNIQGNY
jgi:hypothetical protein